MAEYVKWMPYTHGDQPPFWVKGMLASVEEDGEKVDSNWAWLSWSTYYVPYEAVHGVPRPEVVEEGVEPVDLLNDYQRGVLEGLDMAAGCVEEFLGGRNPMADAIRLLKKAALQETER